MSPRAINNAPYSKKPRAAPAPAVLEAANPFNGALITPRDALRLHCMRPNTVELRISKVGLSDRQVPAGAYVREVFATLPSLLQQLHDGCVALSDSALVVHYPYATNMALNAAMLADKVVFSTFEETLETLGAEVIDTCDGFAGRTVDFEAETDPVEEEACKADTLRSEAELLRVFGPTLKQITDLLSTTHTGAYTHVPTNEEYPRPSKEALDGMIERVRVH